MSDDWPIRTNASACATTCALFCWRIAWLRTRLDCWTMVLYSAKARELGMICAETCERRLGRLPMPRRRPLMACFSAGDASPRVEPEVRAERRLAVAALVFVSWRFSFARFAPLGEDM